MVVFFVMLAKMQIDFKITLCQKVNSIPIQQD
jgi:hypothetical protein